MSTPPMVELTRRRRLSERLRNAHLLMLSLVLVAGLMSFVQIVIRPTSPDDPVYADPVAGTAVDVEAKRENPLAAPEPEDVSWPVAASRAVLDGETADVGGMPVTVVGGDATVRTIDRDDVVAAGVSGTVVGVTADGDVEVRIDYSAFANGYGGGWGDRLGLYRLPDCDTGIDDGCAGSAEAVPVVNDAESRTLGAEVVTGVYAVAASASGSGGSFAATPLGISSQWTAGGPAGAFTWSYPMPTPSTSAGPGPMVNFDYNSQTVDGRTGITNNQGSWIGEGFSFEPGYIERRYKPCVDDGHDGVGDQCWAFDNATIMLAGASGELVKDGDVWRSSTDDGATIERLTGAVNGDDDGEYWKVTTLDGTQYFFGVNRRPGWENGDAETDSVWTTPVFGDDAGEPCHASTFAESHCDQAWRWNLDYTVDPLGNVVSYVYGKETNHYALNADTTDDGVKYTRGGYVKYIEYGQRQDTLFDVPAPARVAFTVAERCLPTSDFDCDPADLTDATSLRWPDVPADQICAAGEPCEPFQVSPSFFTRKRMTAVTTEVFTAGAYAPVDTWALEHTFVDNGDGTKTMWLGSIQRTGHTAVPPVTLPPTELLPVQLENRIDVTGDDISSLVRPRLATVYTDTGGRVAVTYSEMDCSVGDTPTPEANARLCFPVIWQPGSRTEELTDWFHKYVVDEVVVADRVGGGPSQVTRYEYHGDPGWRMTEPDGITKDEFLTWRDWRGFGKVTSISAPGDSTESRTDYVYLRGMHGDDDGSGGTRTVDVTDSTGVAHRDWNELSGRLLETIVHDGAEILGSSITSYWRHVTATETRDWGDELATFVRPSQTRSLLTLSTGAVQETRTDSTYEPDHGRLTQVFDHGVTTDHGDDSCTRVWYADNPAKGMYAYQSRSELVSVGCDVTPDRSIDVLDDTRTSFDGGAWGDAPTIGLQTRQEILKSHDGTTATYLTVSTTEYDGYGRATRVEDAAGTPTTVTYVDVDGRPSTVTAVNALGHTQTGAHEPLRGLPIKSTDANGRTTDMAYDAVGRLVGAWPSFAPKIPGRLPFYAFEYTNPENGPAAAASRYLDIASGTYRLESVAIYDGWMRERQVQAPSIEGNRLVSDVQYDVQGRVAKMNDTYYVVGAPDPSTVITVADGLVNGQVLSQYDSTGRITARIAASAGEELWRTSYSYDGELTHMVPPQGDAAVTTVSDGLGQIVEQRRYHGRELTGAYDSTTYEYGRGGMLSSVTDAVGNVWSYEYDQQARQIVANDPDAGTTTFVYDDLDRLVSTTDARGVTLSTSYDVLGRVTSTWKGDVGTGTKLTETFWDADFKGYESRTHTYAEDFTFISRPATRNWDYRPTSMAYRVEGAAAGALAGTYTQTVDFNDDGTVNSQQIHAANGMPQLSQRFVYDALRRVTSIVGSRTWVSAIGYTETARLSTVHLPMAGTTATQAFEYEHGTNRLDRTWLKRADTAGTLSDVNFDYDDAGNILSIVDAPTAVDSTRDAQCFQYDHARQLTEAWTSAAPGVTSGEVCAGGPETTGVNGPAPYWNSYRFDAAGNRTGVTSRTTGVADSGTDRTYNYPTPGSPGAHQVQSITSGSATMASYLYDEVGNTLSVDRNGALQTITWNAQGKVDTIGEGDDTVEFRYDAGGNEVLRVDQTGRTLYLPGMQLRETTATGEVDWTQYVSLPGGTTAVVTEAGTQYQFADHNGTGQLGIDGTTGEVAHRYTDPYGNPRGSDPTSWSGEKGFVGGTINETTGYTTIGARQYDPVTGKFLSVDPVIDYSDPEQLNPYTYSHANPVTFADPTGLASQSIEDKGAGRTDPESDSPSAEEIEEAQKTLNTSLEEIVIQIAGDLFLDFIGVNDLMACVGDGDIWACVGLVMDVVPWGKVFSVGKKLWKAADRIMSAVAGYDKAVSNAKRVLERAKQAMKKAEDPKKDIDDVAEPTPPKKTDDKPDDPDRTPENADKSKETSCKRHSFTVSAKVVMGDGSTKPIADVEIGDEVLSSDPKTGEVSVELVTALPRTGNENNKLDRDMVDVSVDVDADGEADDTIETTAGHEFWVNLTEASNDGAKWAPARDLASGAWLRTSSGTWVQTTAIATETRLVNTYNLTVANTHTYYVQVADTDTLVHNCGNSRYEAGGKHGSTARPSSRGVNSAEPQNGQAALDNSVPVKTTSPRRIGVDIESGEIVVLDRTGQRPCECGGTIDIFHGHVRSWADLHVDMQNVLKRAGLVDKKGRIVG